jgi:hypothetical protein
VKLSILPRFLAHLVSSFDHTCPLSSSISHVSRACFVIAGAISLKLGGMIPVAKQFFTSPTLQGPVVQSKFCH